MKGYSTMFVGLSFIWAVGSFGLIVYTEGTLATASGVMAIWCFLISQAIE